MSELLDWAERAGLENLRERRQNADYLQKEGVTTLTIFLAGAAGGLAYCMKGVETAAAWLAVGGAFFSAYLFILSMILVFTVLRIRPIPSLHNEPLNLYQKEFSLEKLREAELANIQHRIKEARCRNDLVAGWLNRLRILAVFSPIVLAVTSGLVWALGLFAPALAGEQTATALLLGPALAVG